jgi:hypothetical protein
MNGGLNTGINTGLNSGLDSSLDSGLGTGVGTGLGSSSLDSGLGFGLDTGSSLDMNGSTGIDTGLGSSLDSGMGSSSGDFGSFASSSGGDMGPVVLDLANQGIRLTGLSSSQARFDADGNGVPNRIAWILPGEGLLAVDANESGTVDQTRELALSEWKPGARTDLQGLSAFDTNHDGALDGPDEEFGRFDIWRDSNGNGVSDPGELSSLVEAGVKSIQLASDGARSTLPDGSTIYGQGSFTRTDGSSGRLADVALAYAPDISAARDQLAGAMATGAGGAAPALPPVSAPPPTGLAPLLGINAAPLQPHAR